MNKFFKSLLIVLAAVPVLVSCNKDEDNDYPSWGAYVTVTAEDSFYYFTGDDGETYYPGDVSRIGRYDARKTEGKRAYIYFNFLEEKKEGYDYNVELYRIVDILSKTVEVAENAEEVAEAGDDRLHIRRIVIEDNWLDIAFSLMADYGSKHKMTLLDNRTVDPPASMPEGYQYLEFRQYASNGYDRYLSDGNVSYDLGEYAPSIAGSKGLYIRFRDLRGQVEYVTVEYKPSIQSPRQGKSTAPAPTGDWIW